MLPIRKTWFQVIWGYKDKYKKTSALKKFNLPEETNIYLNQYHKRHDEINSMKEVEPKYIGSRRITEI